MNAQNRKNPIEKLVTLLGVASAGVFISLPALALINFNSSSFDGTPNNRTHRAESTQRSRQLIAQSTSGTEQTGTGGTTSGNGQVNGQQGTFEQYMTAGYAATQQRDYPTALAYFQSALQLRPGNRYAVQAIRNVQGYMQRGDTATPGNQGGNSTNTPGNQGGNSTNTPGNQGGNTTNTPGNQGGTTNTPGNQGGTTNTPGNQGGTTNTPGNQGGTTNTPGNQGGTTTTPGNQGGTTTTPGNQGGTTTTPGNRGGTTTTPGNQGGTTTTPGNRGGTTTTPGNRGGTTTTPGNQGNR